MENGSEIILDAHYASSSLSADSVFEEFGIPG